MAKTKNEGLPHNIDAEIYIIASAMLFEDAWDKITETSLNADDFFDKRNSLLFTTITNMKNANMPVQLISITEKLRTDKNIEAAGGADYISSLIDNFPTSAYISHFVDIVKKKSMLRKLIVQTANLMNLAYDDPEDVKELLDKAEQEIMNINQDIDTGAITHIKPIVNNEVQRLVKKVNTDGELSGVTSGFSELDERTDGFQKQELIIIAARPSVGKTAFALNLLANAALKGNKSAGFFSCEMSKESLIIRMLCSEAKIDQRKYRKNLLSQQDRVNITVVADQLYDTQIVFDDTPHISIFELRSKARKMKREYNVDILFIDYLQLLSAGSDANANMPRHEQIAFISRSLKSLARELDIPIIALAQLNRNVDSRGDHAQPKLSDLKDSGSIEQDADVIMFLHRKESPENNADKDTDLRQLIIGKNRNGPTDIIDMVFIKASTKFQLATKDYQ